MLASQTDKMSFLEGSKLVIDGAIRSLTNSLAGSLFRSGTGSIGQISGSPTTTGTGPYTTTIQLVNISDVTQFEVNMYIVASSTDGGAASTDALVVTGVNRVKGIVTLTSAATPTGTWAANAYLTVQGDTNLKLKGLSAWLPFTDPANNDNFFGVNRSVDRVRLAGVAWDGSGQTIEEAVIDASAILAREGGKPDVCLLPFASYSALEKSLGSKIQYTSFQTGEIGFRGILINGANSVIRVIPDRSAQAQVGYLLQMNTWKLESLGEAPMILRYGDGLQMLRVSNADAGEVRVGYYAQLRTNAPGWNANVKLSA